MGQYLPEENDYPLEAQVKTLGDDELLDFWEETQHIERSITWFSQFAPFNQLEFERIILQELMLRSCMRGAGGPNLP